MTSKPPTPITVTDMYLARVLAQLEQLTEEMHELNTTLKARVKPVQVDTLKPFKEKDQAKGK